MLWQYGDTVSWTKGKHFYKFGGEIRRGGSWGLDAGIGTTAIPRVTGGDLPLSQISATAISTTNMPGLAGTNATGNNVRMRNLLSFLAGSVSSITQDYYMQDPDKLDAFDDYKKYPGKVRDMRINEFTFFFKDDWKVMKSLTLNLGLRYDYYGVPYETNGLMPLPVGGGNAAFGISGRSFNDWMSAWSTRRPDGDPVCRQELPKSRHRVASRRLEQFWSRRWLCLAGSVVWRGEDDRPRRISADVSDWRRIQLHGAGNQRTGKLEQRHVYGGQQRQCLSRSHEAAFVDSGARLLKPMQPIPLTERSQEIYVPDPNLVTPYAQNLTLSVTRSVGSKVSVDLRYVGTLGRKQRSAANNINVPNFRSNGLKEAFDAVRRGDESALLNPIFNGINIAGAGFGPVGTPFSGVQQTAGMHMRQSTTFNSNLANGNYMALAASLNTLNYATASNPTLPVIPALVQGQVLRHNGFPENFIVTNPQFGAVNLMTNNISNNYHSLAAQVTLRPVRGVSTQTTYTWSKNLGAGFPGADRLGQVFTDPLDRHGDYAVLPDTRVHDFRSNGTFALPFGPNQVVVR